MDIKNKIFHKSSESMDELPDNSVDLIVTSPPYNINIKYGNKWSERKITGSKSIKYKDDLNEEKYLEMIEKVCKECKRVLKKNGTILKSKKHQKNEKL